MSARIFSICTLALVACSVLPEDDATLSDLDQAFDGLPLDELEVTDVMLPPPGPMTLEATALVPGDTMLVTADGANPGDTVAFTYGLDAGSTCPPQLGGSCLGLDAAQLLDTATANAAGTAVIAVAVPLSLPVGTQVGLQAAVAAGADSYLSQVLGTVAEAVCGDNLQQSSEECDDGGTVDFDGCSAGCLLEYCGDTVVQPPETCDDGGTVSGDGCSATCQVEFVNDFLMNVFDADIARRDWDPDPLGIFVKPDAFYRVYVDTVWQYTSNTASDTYTPRFDDLFEVHVPAGSTLHIDFYDADPLPPHDWIGSLSLTHAQLNVALDTGLQTMSDHELRSVRLSASTP